MNESIHGHNVLKLIKGQDTPLSHEQQLKALHEHFGKLAQYHTCSLQGLTAEQLLSLFIEKGKLAMDGNKINFVGCQCKH